jgi:sugar/nucleoside kinase (ribokinase family)
MVALAPPPGESLRRADRWLVDHAGAESNTCVGLARLGLKVAWVSRLGQDAAGDRILDALAAEGVETTWVRRDSLRPTGVMLKDPAAGVRYYRSGSAASAMSPDLLDGVPVQRARAILVSGITALIGSTAHAAGLAFLEAGHGLRIVDPNLRHGLWGSDRRAALVLPFIERCNLLLSGVSELEEILSAAGRAGGSGESGGSREAGGANAAEALAWRATAHGPREVVVRSATTIGARGSRRSDRRRRRLQCRLHCRAPRRRPCRGGAARRHPLRDGGDDRDERYGGVSTSTYVAVPYVPVVTPLRSHPFSNSFRRPPVRGCSAHAS